MKQLALLACAVLWAPAAHAAESDPVHSDTPLWTNDAAHMWPQHIREAKTFGCTHRIKLGDWAYTPLDQHGGPESWLRLTNYGLVHCFIVERRAYAPERLSGGQARYSMLIELGPAQDAHGRAVELWALQSGARPGSDYMLLSRPPGDGVITAFDVLRTECPKDALRGGENIDILLTRYCAINTQADLRALAQRMARLPPLGNLKFDRPEPPDPDAPAATPRP